MSELGRRVSKAERQAGIGTGDNTGPLRVYFTEGPREADAHAYLASLGRELGPADMVVHFVGAGTMADLTEKFPAP